MKRLAAFAFYAVGALAIVYLALYAYAALTGRQLQPGDPIHIFRKPDAPNYSSTWSLIATKATKQSGRDASAADSFRFARDYRAHPVAVAAARG
jgi:hypothetical protein